jgi:hypothetical protein
MGLVKWLCKRFRCKSDCEIDGNVLHNDYDVSKYNLNDYNLKIKDIDKIVKILGKRELKKLEKTTIQSITI